MSVRHHHPDCTGRWGVHTIYLASYWRCDRCGAIGDASVQNYAKAIHENLLGNRLDQLTSEGRNAAGGSVSRGLYSRYKAIIWRAAIAVTLLLWALLINVCYRLWS